METEENPSSSGWDHTTTRLLISTRVKYENEFKEGRIRKTQIWKSILNEMQQINPNIKFSTFELTKKFNNLLVTYKRIKNRSHISGGKVTTSWEYFDNFDSVYHDIIFSPKIEQNSDVSELKCSPSSPSAAFNGLEYWNQLEEEQEEEQITMPTEVVHIHVPQIKQEFNKSRGNGIRNNSARASTSGVQLKGAKSKKAMKNVGDRVRKDQMKEKIFNYLKYYDEKVEKRHRQKMKIEQKKIQVEEEKLTILTEIRDILRERENR